MTSRDSINYSIRPNKAVERKLIFEILGGISPALEFGSYRYIGFGSMWFVDFIMAHKLLSIADMISIEEDEFDANRAEFNKPFGCVKIFEGESSIILPTIALEEKRALVWLDYTASLDGSVIDDLSVLCQRAPLGSVVVTTINAHKGSLPTRDNEEKPIEKEVDRLHYIAGNLVPGDLPPDAMQASKYPALLARILFEHVRHSLRKAGRDNELIFPLFNLRYQDNAPMITIGFVIADTHLADHVARLAGDRGVGSYLDVSSQQTIAVPSLTFREKGSLDQLMPAEVSPTPEAVAALGFRLRPSQIESYYRFYRHYPTFSEISI